MMPTTSELYTYRSVLGAMKTFAHRGLLASIPHTLDLTVVESPRGCGSPGSDSIRNESNNHVPAIKPGLQRVGIDQ
jgi:hypothetical protein